MSESITALFNESVKRFDKQAAIQYFCTKENLWVFKNWSDISFIVNKLANALRGLGVKEQEPIALLSMTRPEWLYSDIAIMKTSSIVVPIYHSSLSDQIDYILGDSGAKIIFVENEEQLKKVRQIQNPSHKLNKIIIFDNISGPLKENEIYLDDLIINQSSILEETPTQTDHVASLVYTSGTTGEPKGAMISHDNLLYEAQAIDKLGVLTNNDVQLLFLPLAHIFARVLAVSWIRTGHLLAFARSINTITEDMEIIKPTFMAGVPRIFEKIRSKAMESALKGNFITKRLVSFAFNEADRLTEPGEQANIKTIIAQKLVFDKIGDRLKKLFGGKIRFLVSGGAQLSLEVFTFFKLCGITLCEGYGLTETTAATCLNLPWALKKGTVGKAMPGTEVKLSDDGEILVKGRGVFLGFWNKEDYTKEVLSDDGWFATGDMGHIDNDGYVTIVDRKRDIIVTSQGKNISPQRVENLIKSKSQIIAHVVVIGDKKPYLTALIALEPTVAQEIAQSTDLSLSELCANSLVFKEVNNSIKLANESLASFEQIKRFKIIDKEFVVGEELTPTLKVKRKTLIEKFKHDIKILYA